MYCTKCGEKLIETTEPKKHKEKMKTVDKIALAIVILLIASFLFMFFGPAIFPYGLKRGLVREATNEDVEIDCVPNYENNILEIIITPNKDIKELKLDIYYETKEGDRFPGFYETVGSVKEGIQVKEQIPLSEALLKTFFENKIIVKVKEGYVPYLQ